MPFSCNGSTRIHYEIEGSGPPLVLHHWTFADLEWWRELGFAERLNQSCTLILIDSRAHGQSDCPATPGSYGLEARVQDVVSVLDQIEVPKAHFLGFSMGGWIGYGMAIHAPERLCSLTLGGAHPFAQSMQGARDFLSIGATQGAKAFIDAWESAVEPVTPAQRQRMLTYNFPAMIAAAQDREDLAELLANNSIPTRLFVGEKDGICERVVATADVMPRSQVEIFPGKDHGGTLHNFSEIVRIVQDQLKEHACGRYE